MSVLIGLILVVASVISPSTPQELRNGTACKEELLQLVCGNEEILAIHQAFFDGRDTEGCGFLMPINISSLLTNITEEEPAVNNNNNRRFSVQSSINRRCSGQNNCTLQLENDEPQAKQWGNGKLHVQYNCIPAKSARHSCDAVIEIVSPDSVTRALASTDSLAAVVGGTTTRPPWFPGPDQVQGWGYVHQMGYPEYYRTVTGEKSDCRWTIRATQGRRVRITLLDLSIRSVLHGERECKDLVTVTENSRLLLNKCGEVEEPLVIESSGDELNITLQLKSQFIPKRGLLAYFTAMGCPTPKIPNKAHLVSGSNSSRAELSCSVDHVFPDTGSRFRTLTCLDHQGIHRWNEDLPDCVDIRDIHASGNKSLIHILKKAMNQSTGPEVSELTNYSLTYDLIVPSSIIAGLVLGNLIVLAAVIHCRRRNTKRSEKSGGEEGEPLQATPGPSDATAQQPPQRVGTPV